MSNHGTRFQVSVRTFGPGGRLAITAFVVAVPVFLLLYANPGYLLALAMWVFVIMPRVLKDVWRRAVLPETDLSQLRDRAAREAAVPAQPREHRAFQDPPTRW